MPDLMSLETEIKVTGLTQGATYRARYRASNQIGAGDWSDISYLLVANVPIATPMPILVSVDNLQITVNLPISQNARGAPINAYNLFINEGSALSPFHELLNYDGMSRTYTFQAGYLITNLITLQAGNLI